MGPSFTKDKQTWLKNRAALKAAEAKGVHVVITTGRLCQHYSYLGRLLGLLDDKHYSVTFNDGLVQRIMGGYLIRKMIEDLKQDLYCL